MCAQMEPRGHAKGEENKCTRPSALGPQSGQVDSQSGQVDPQSGQVDRQKDTKEQTKSAYKTSHGFVRTLLPSLAPKVDLSYTSFGKGPYHLSDPVCPGPPLSRLRPAPDSPGCPKIAHMVRILTI
jgi:hypothetical protein